MAVLDLDKRQIVGARFGEKKSSCYNLDILKSLC